MVAILTLTGAQARFVQYVQQNAPGQGLDPQAVIADAMGEGMLHNGRGGFYGDPYDLSSNSVGDGGTSFGPFQLHMGGTLPSWVAAQGKAFAQSWAWSNEGIAYAMSRMSAARGLTGSAAIDAIVRYFEIPADISGAIASRIHNLGDAAAALGQAAQAFPGGVTDAPSPVPLPGSGQIPGQGTAPAQGDVGASGQVAPTTTATLPPGMLKLGQIGPVQVGVPSGLLLGLLAVLLLVVGAIILAPESAKQTAMTAVMV